MHPSHITYQAAQRHFDPKPHHELDLPKRRRLTAVAALFRALAPLSVLHPGAEHAREVCCG
jgi:hypothetical protein